jgi:hypothetical protein
MVCYIRHLGYPPPDIAVRDFLTPFNSRDEDEHMQETSYSRASHFLFSLLIHTKDVVVRFGAEEKKDRVVRFREFMSKGQRFGHVGYDRWKFYNDVVTRAKMVCWILFIKFIPFLTTSFKGF